MSAERAKQLVGIVALLLTALMFCDLVTPPAAAAQETGPQLPVPGSEPDRAGSEARRILGGDDYRSRSPGRSIADRIRDWIRDHMPELGGDGPGLPRGLSLVIIAVLVLGSAALIALGLVRTRRGRGRADAEKEGGEIEITPLRSVDEWNVEAERLEALGAWRDALRARYRALAGTLVERDLLSDLPGRTPGEHRLELTRSAPAAAGAFATATGLFEAAWFGRAEVADDDLGRFRSLADDVLDAADRNDVREKVPL